MNEICWAILGLALLLLVLFLWAAARAGGREDRKRGR